jgi:hypothetical protein
MGFCFTEMTEEVQVVVGLREEMIMGKGESEN